MTAVRTLSCLLFVLSLGPATGDSDNMLKVGGFLQFCKAGAETAERAHCVGYVSAVWDVLTVTRADDVQVNKEFAVCGKVKYRAMVQAFVNWAEKHPDQWEEPRSLGVAKALTELWPCK